MNEKYLLKLYDEPLLSFEYSKGRNIDTLVVSNIEVLCGRKEVFPLNMELSADGVSAWLSRRAIPKNREFVEEILRSLGLQLNDHKAILDVCKGLSLNDSYWVVPSGFGGKYSEYNLYENRFSEILSLVAYTGIGASDPAFTTSPELTTDGMLPKAWRYIENEGIYLFKGGTSGASNTGCEPFSEFYACQIAQKMGLNAITYGLEKWKGMLASTCKLFTDIDTAYLSIGKIVKTGGIDAVLTWYYERGEEFSNAIRDMLVFDALVYNEDRHFGNFGVLRDNLTGKIIAPAPLFDHGLALFNFITEEKAKNIDKYAKERFPAYPILTFEEIVKSVITKRQAAQLRKIINFKFTRHEQYNLPEWRLTAIEEHLQRRVRQLLDIAAQKDIKEKYASQYKEPIVHEIRGTDRERLNLAGIKSLKTEFSTDLVKWYALYEKADEAAFNTALRHETDTQNFSSGMSR